MAEQRPVFQLMDGKVIPYDADRPKLYPNIKGSWIRLDSLGSGSVLLSMGAYYTFRHLSRISNGDPEPTHAEFVIRITEAGTFLVLALTNKNKPEAREFKITNSEYRILRDINPQLVAAELQIDPDTLYTMDVSEAQDPKYGRVLAANWSTAVATPRPEKHEGETKKDETKKDETKGADAQATTVKAQAAAASQPAEVKAKSEVDTESTEEFEEIDEDD